MVTSQRCRQAIAIMIVWALPRTPNNRQHIMCFPWAWGEHSFRRANKHFTNSKVNKLVFRRQLCRLATKHHTNVSFCCIILVPILPALGGQLAAPLRVLPWRLGCLRRCARPVTWPVARGGRSALRWAERPGSQCTRRRDSVGVFALCLWPWSRESFTLRSED